MTLPRADGSCGRHRAHRGSPNRLLSRASGLVTGEVVGPTLAQVLALEPRDGRTRGGGRTCRALVRHVGRLAEGGAGGTPSRNATSASTAMRTYLDKRLDDLETSGADSPDDRPAGGPSSATAMRSSCRSARRNSVQSGSTPTSVPDNIIIRSGEITVLDFMMAKTGTVYHDVAHLFMHVESMKVKPWFRPAVIDGLQRDLLTGFRAGP